MTRLGWAQPGDDDYVEDGVHLDLDADRYFRQGIGSTDLIDLWFKKEGWWGRSPWNRRRKRTSTKEQLYGSAAHAIILEGIGAYEKRFVAEPDWASIPGLFDRVEDIKAAVRDAGYRIDGPPMNRWLKADWVQALADNDIDVPCRSLLQMRFDRDTRTKVSAEDDETLRFLREVMLDPTRDDNVEIREIFGDQSRYPALVEVSILHTMPDGVRRRWRIDRMFPAFDLDLKTLGDWRGRPLRFATGDIIAARGYDIQRADYHYGRQVAYEYIKAGRLHGGTLDQKAWLLEWPERFPTWDWKWLFYQKPNWSKGHAPVLFPIHDDAGSTIHEAGARKAAVALRRFVAYRDKYGMDRPWARVEPLHYTDESEGAERAVIFPHWIDQVDEGADFPDHVGDEDSEK